MKKLILLAIFLLFTKTAQAGLVSWWKMDEASWNGTASEVVDSVGTNHGTASGATTVPGKDNRAGYFDGTNDYVSVTDADSIDLGGDVGTISMWLWLKVDATYKYPISKKVDIWSSSGYAIAVKSSSTQFLGSGTNVGAGSGVGVTGWRNLVVVFNKGTCSIYIDGVDVTTDSSYSPIVATTANLFIGSLGGTGSYFNGTIDEVRIYNHALTAAEVAHQYFLGSQTRLR